MRTARERSALPRNFSADSALSPRAPLGLVSLRRGVTLQPLNVSLEFRARFSKSLTNSDACVRISYTSVKRTADNRAIRDTDFDDNAIESAPSMLSVLTVGRLD